MAFPSESNSSRFFSNKADNEDSDNEQDPFNEEPPLKEQPSLNEVEFDHFKETTETLLTNDKVIILLSKAFL